MSLASLAEIQALSSGKYRAAHINQAIRSVATIAPIVMIDAFSLLLAMSTAQLVLSVMAPEVHYALYRQLLPLLAIATTVFPLCGAYALCGLNPSKEFREIVSACIVSFATLLMANILLGDDTTKYEFTLLLLSLGFSLLFHPLLRGGGRALLGRCDWWGWPVLVVGEDGHCGAVVRYLSTHSVLGMRPVAVIGENDFAMATTYLERDRVARSLSQMHVANHVVLALPESNPIAMREAIDLWASHVNHVIVVLSLPSLPTLWTETHDYGGMLGLHARAKLLSPWRLLMKKGMDLALILLAAPLILPVIALLSLLVKGCSPGPVFYGSERVGRNGKKFKAWKFRTMIPNANEALQSYLAEHPELLEEWEREYKLKNDPRIIPHVGSLMRTLSLDELPQLWNVLCGEMSLVGPRPILDEETEQYRETLPLYLKVMPGITGLWQVSGRNNTTYEERIAYVAYYVRNWSPWLDCYILARTIKTVIFREGAF